MICAAASHQSALPLRLCCQLQKTKSIAQSIVSANVRQIDSVGWDSDWAFTVFVGLLSLSHVVKVLLVNNLVACSLRLVIDLQQRNVRV